MKTKRLSFGFGLLASLLFLMALPLKANAFYYDVYPKPGNLSGQGGNPVSAIASQAGDWGPPPAANPPEYARKFNCRPGVYPPGPYQDAAPCATGLTTGGTTYEVFKPKNGLPLSITLLDACDGDNDKLYNKPGAPDKGARGINVTFNQTQANGSVGPQVGGGSSASCGGGPNLNNLIVPAGAFTPNHTNRYGAGVETALVRVSRDSIAPGQQFFRIATNMFGSEVANSGGRSFALASQNDNTSGSGDYEFNFRKDCSDDSGGQGQITITDIDYYRYSTTNDAYTIQKNDNVVIEISGPGIPTETRNFNSGTEYNDNGRKVSFTIPLSGLIKGQSYKLTAKNIGNVNGLNFRIPFSEYKGSMDCGDGISPDPSCTTFTHLMDNNSRYRFTTFARDGDYGFNGPPNRGDKIGRKAGDGRRPWRSFTQAPVDQREIVNTSGNRQNTSFNYPEPAGPDWITYVERWQRDGNTRDGRERYEYGLLDSPKKQLGCYVAKCESPGISSGSIPGRPNGVEARKSFTLSLVIRNIGRANLPASTRGYSLTATDTVWPFVNGAGGGIARGAARAVNIPLTAPSGIQSKSLNPYADYNGLFSMQGGCPITVDVYERYDFKATASSQPDDPESPTAVNFSSTLTQLGATTVDGTATRTFSKRRDANNTPLAGYGPYSQSRSFETVTYPNGPGDPEYSPYTIPPGSYVLGDSWCMSINLNRGHGFRGPNNDYAANSPESADNCGGAPTVVDQPYIRSYGADVAAGGGFDVGGNCAVGSDPPRPRILSFLRPIAEHRLPDPASPRGLRSNKSGSGGQLAAMALGEIRGFTSASTRSSAPQEPRGLTFANTDPATYNTTTDSNPWLGGKMSGDGFCAPDYFGTTQYPEGDRKAVSTSTAGIDVKDLPANKQTLRNLPPGAKVELTSSAPLTGGNRHTVYVDGDVYIKSNMDGGIVYNTDYSGGVPSIPSFTLVARGNIYIDKDVNRLDGLYIAQPKEGQPASGRIYTCSEAGSPVTAPGLVYQHCGAANSNTPNRQLKVNGAFVAKRVVLNRVGHSIGDSTFREQADTSKAAEIFSFNQEIYLSPPVFRPSGTFTSGDYDYIAILAPIL